MGRYEQEVNRGAALLDEILPGWVEKIDLEALELDSDCQCVLGQLALDLNPRRFVYSRYGAAIQAIEQAADIDLGAQEFFYGFNLPSNWGGPADFTDLTQEWRALIQQRREGVKA